MKKLKFACLGIIAIIIFLAVIGRLVGTDEADSESVSATASEQIKPAEPKKPEWEYRKDTDKMSGTAERYASIESSNKIEFEFPYNEKGGSSFRLTIRNMGKGGDEVLLRVSKGQFLSSFGDSEKCRVKFDDDAAINFTYSGSNSGNSNLIFFNNSKRFITRLKTAEKLMIGCTFFQTSEKYIEFNEVKGLEW